ncbi:mevalonate kinase [Streptomyces iconiensis]|uniref:mevalonate kinase n=1 Tax=Streptomyces iconiensis TaxID=1384038 RepID=A0ABT7A1D8_9ACTN|nr:mevalonate kinase [Streptomyces iconiensis]MDJ1135139.1 mevalonate kinase [Streptomyces iconiensis]
MSATPSTGALTDCLGAMRTCPEVVLEILWRASSLRRRDAVLAQNTSDAEQLMNPQPEPRAGPDAELPGTGTGTAHGKVVLLGEHAVVYGAPALALPVPALGCRARVVRRDQGGHGLLGLRMVQVQPGMPSGVAPLPPHTQESSVPEGLRTLTETVLRDAGLRSLPGVDVLVESGVPPARGLGSSAACARSLALALDDLLGLQLSADAVFHRVQASEKAAHGRASGIDALATGSRRPVLLADGHISNPPVGADGWITVADSGSGAGTRKAVAMLRDGFARDPGSREVFLHRSATLTRAGLRDMERGRLEALGGRLTDCHTLLAGLGLTTGRTDRLVDAALRAGALGAKMSGGGLGGCVIALTATERAADALAAQLTAEHGARCWRAPLAKGERHAG